jgi:hypothetical protein
MSMTRHHRFGSIDIDDDLIHLSESGMREKSNEMSSSDDGIDEDSKANSLVATVSNWSYSWTHNEKNNA